MARGAAGTRSARTLFPEAQELLRQVVGAVREVEPGAQVILYGSRARGNAAHDSDWDLLVLVEGEVDRGREEAVRRTLYTLELGRPDFPVLSSIVVGKRDWNSPRYRCLPFHDNVERDGLELAPSTAGVALVPRPPARRSRAMQEERKLSEAREVHIQRRLKRARDAQLEVEAMAQLAHWNACVSRLYYACFYAVSGWLLRHGRGSSRHSGVRAMFNQLLARPGAVSPAQATLYNQLFKNRQDADYADDVEFDEQQVRPWMEQAREFVERMETLISAGDQGSSAQ